MVNCKICGEKSDNEICNICQYFLDNGVSEETIKKILVDDSVKDIWKANEKYSEELANAYYKSVIKHYKQRKDDSKENFGYNTFTDGIRVGLDIIMPIIGDKEREVVIHKIKSMIDFRKKQKRRKEESV